MERYGQILRKAQALGYWLPKVRDVAFGIPDRKLFLIRHDVDITPWAALEMARFEKERGVETTYYYRLHAETYNLLDPDVLASMLEVHELGHEIGLHYEPGFFLDRGEDPLVGVRRDLRFFEELLGFETQTLAQHQPATGPVLAEISEKHGDAYQPALVREMPYFGDSGFHWREGCVIEKLGVYEQIHTLIHPHSWTRSGRPWQDVLRLHAEELGQRLGSWMEGYIQHVEEYLAERPRLDREREERYQG
ncbi:MAG: hypothetical protein CSA62_04870 [Planctomycetota bacterium]|nr:MAG: hypothetical protein CSA62_04870 [Planctomycetota bacterium]